MQSEAEAAESLMRGCSALGDLQCVRVRASLSAEERRRPSALNTRDATPLWTPANDATLGKLGITLGGGADMSSVMVDLGGREPFIVSIYHDAHLERVALPPGDVRRRAMKYSAMRVISEFVQGRDPRAIRSSMVGELAEPVEPKKRARK